MEGWMEGKYGNDGERGKPSVAAVTRDGIAVITLLRKMKHGPEPGDS